MANNPEKRAAPPEESLSDGSGLDDLLGGVSAEEAKAAEDEEPQSTRGRFAVCIPASGGRPFECEAEDEEDAKAQFRAAVKGLTGDYVLNVERI